MLKVLLMIDGSKNSQRAVKYVNQLNALCHEPFDLHLLNVQPMIISGNVQRFIGQEAINKYYQETGNAALAKARQLLDKQGTKYTIHISVGDVTEVAMQYIKEHKIQQIAMGARGLNSFEGFLLGSVATKIIHCSAVPIWVVK